jgi:hypothetical protein
MNRGVQGDVTTQELIKTQGIFSSSVSSKIVIRSLIIGYSHVKDDIKAITRQGLILADTPR